jgi:protein tyrosine phosphatase (PTP) superfamily phosphohydrolase (DUF442 family)
MIKTVFTRKLLRSSRPGYPLGKTAPVPEPVVLEWISELREASVASILCLLDDQHLSMYQHCAQGRGLLAAYSEAGFQVGHVPIEDHKAPPVSEAELECVLTLYDTLPEPVLIHCSAGIGRTGAVVDHIRKVRPTD